MLSRSKRQGFPGGSVVKNLLATADPGSIPGLGRPTSRGATKPMHNY